MRKEYVSPKANAVVIATECMVAQSLNMEVNPGESVTPEDAKKQESDWDNIWK